MFIIVDHCQSMLRCMTLSEPSELIHKDEFMEVIQILSQDLQF